MTGKLMIAAPQGRERTEEEKRAQLIRLVLDSVTSEHSKRAYRTGLEQFFAWWKESASEMGFSRALLQRYRSELETQVKSAATINQRLAPLRKLAEEAAAAGMLAPADAGAACSIKGARLLGQRTGFWLTRNQAEQLLTLPNRETLSGKRDYVLFTLLIGAGLRRDELAGLKRSWRSFLAK